MKEPGENAPDEITLTGLLEKWKAEKREILLHEQQAFCAEAAIFEYLLGHADMEEVRRIMTACKNLLV